MSVPSSSSPSSAPLALPAPRSPLVHGLWLVPLLVLAVPVVLSLGRKWTRSIWDNGHGLFVPVLVAVLGYDALKRCPVKSEEPSPWGFAFLLPALSLLVLSAVVRVDFVRSIALLLCLPGLSLLLLGPRRTRAIRFPLFLTFFMLPLPPQILVPLQDFLQELSAAGTEVVLQALGQPALADATLLYLPHGTFRVVAQCSGFSALYAGITVALVLAHLSSSWRRRLLLVIVAAPLAIASNVFRITLLAVLAEWRGFQILDTPAHVMSGYLTFVLTLGLLFLIAQAGGRKDAH